jgi:hypothetical protein
MMAEFVDDDNQPCGKFLCRVTGKQSVERLEPLIASVVPATTFCDATVLRSGKILKLDFVWETTCEKDLKQFHQNATILNRLHNSHIIESKASFAYLQLIIQCPMLETRVAVSAREVAGWAERRWGTPQISDVDENTSERDWWVVKASKGNGGRDIWVFNPQNFREVIPQLPVEEEYVIQK